MTNRTDVMISCTRRDLAPHIAEAKAGIEQAGMFALVQENMPASPDDAIAASIRMVNEAEIYLGIFGRRYGYRPDSPQNPDQRSVTELEYRRAVARNLPRFIFIMHDDHPPTPDDETDPDGITRLIALKDELKTNYVVAFFTSPEDLRGHVLHALHTWKERGSPNIHAMLTPPDPGTLAEPGLLPPGSRALGGRNPHFVGREDDMIGIARGLLHGANAGDAKNGGAATVITPAAAATGSGGIGKTQLALEFAHRYGRYFRGVHWINLLVPEGADLDAHLRAEVAACGRAMNLPEFPPDTEQPQQVQATLAHWQQSPPRLVILDNAANPAQVQRVLPLIAGARVLVTSRWGERDEWGAVGVRACPLDTLSRPESIALLRALTPDRQDSDADLDALSARLGDFPLALDLAGRYLNKLRRAGLTVADYRAQIDASAVEHSSLTEWAARANQTSPTQHDTNVAATFQLSWAQVTDPLAQRLFRACGYLAPNTPVPPELLKRLAADDDGETDIEAFADALGQLVQVGLLHEKAPEGDDGGGLQIHPLLADFARALDTPDDAPAGDADAGQLARVGAALARMTKEAGETGLPANFAPLRPHVEEVAPRADEAEVEDAAALWTNLGYHLRAIADYPAARQHYERALAIGERVLGPDHPNVAIRLNNLGSLLQDLGDLPAARQHFERALAIRERVLGQEHPDTAQSLNNLGALLKDLGDLPAARQHYERALRIFEGVLGADHPNVATLHNNLGMLLQDLGDLPAARQHLERALAIDERVLGPDHPNVAIRLNNLGMLLKDLGDLPAARQHFERALAIDERVLGPDHPNVAIRLNNLGSLLHDLGDLPAARQHLERALAIDERVLGPDHPKVAIRLNNLGSLLKDLGDLPAARGHYQRALRIFEARLPPGHPHIEIVRRGLAGLGA